MPTVIIKDQEDNELIKMRTESPAYGKDDNIVSFYIPDGRKTMIVTFWRDELEAGLEALQEEVEFEREQ